MPEVLAAATGSDWNAGGSLLTFYFPVGLFIVVAVSLYLQFSRPHTVPGLRPLRSRPRQNDGTPLGPDADHDSEQAREDS